ncbi:MAG: substrate-binding domain-containing protein [Streptosporangiales bacterium]|nr:substrate-binding domain-containing protein [Streptosporangiales bacterium]
MRLAIKITVLAMAGTVMLGGAGCDGGGGEASNEAKKVTIGWTPPDNTGVFKTATNYFNAAAKQANKNGFDVEVLTRSPATHTDFADQLTIVEDFVSKNVDVIVISPSDVQAAKPAIKRANQSNIPVIVVNLLEKQSDIEVASYIGFDNSDAAQVTAYSVLDYYGGPGFLGTGEKVDVEEDTYLDLKWWRKLYADADKQAPKANGAVIEGIAGTFFSDERNKGFTDVLRDYPNVKTLGKPLAADWNREKGVKAAENFASRYDASEMNFIWGSSNEMALGAIQALQRRDMLNTAGPTVAAPKDKVSIFTNDNTPESTDAIRDGKIIAETTHGFPEWGWFGAQFAVQLACDQKVPATFDIRPRTVWKDNADRFYPDPKLEPIDWKKIRTDC